MKLQFVLTEFEAQILKHPRIRYAKLNLTSDILFQFDSSSFDNNIFLFIDSIRI